MGRVILGTGVVDKEAGTCVNHARPAQQELLKAMACNALYVTQAFIPQRDKVYALLVLLALLLLFRCRRNVFLASQALTPPHQPQVLARSVQQVIMLAAVEICVLFVNRVHTPPLILASCIAAAYHVAITPRLKKWRIGGMHYTALRAACSCQQALGPLARRPAHLGAPPLSTQQRATARAARQVPLMLTSRTGPLRRRSLPV